MADYSHPYIVIRQDDKFTVGFDGASWRVNDIPADAFASAADIDGNPRHYLKGTLAALRQKAGRDDLAGILRARINGDFGGATTIAIWPDQYAKAAGAITAYAVWTADQIAKRLERQQLEREHDLAFNEGCDGYNPYRDGSKPTYRHGA